MKTNIIIAQAETIQLEPGDYILQVTQVGFDEDEELMTLFTTILKD